jgi:hypothetical protein
MAYTVTRSTGYGSRVGNSCLAVPLGLLLFLLATALLWWNEGRAVHRTQDIKEVGKTAQSIGDISAANPSLDGQLIHATGTTSTNDTLSDATFDLRVNALALIRSVEFYQWKENEQSEVKEKIGGTREETITYTYERGWSNRPINSSSFAEPDYKDVNTVLWNIEDKRELASNVNFGSYKLPELFIRNIASSMLSNTQPIQLPKESHIWTELNDDVIKTLETTNQEVKKLADSLAYIHVTGNQLYIGLNPSNPAIGDLRITFQQITPSCDISLIAVPQSGTFTTYKAKNNESEYELRLGIHTLEEMIQAANDENEMMTWLFRFLGAMLVIVALKMIFSIVETLLKVLPFLANIIGWGVGVVCTVLGIAWSLVVIGIAWIFYRPILGISLLVIAGALVYFFAIKGKDKRGNLNDAEGQVPMNG